MRTLAALRGLAGALFLVQLLLGIFFWMGHAPFPIGLHMVLGALFVLTLLAQAGLALREGAPPIPAVALAALAAAIAWLGFNQMTLLPGPNHWIVRIIHLLLAIAAMPLSGRLPKMVPSGASASPEGVGS